MKKTMMCYALTSLFTFTFHVQAQEMVYWDVAAQIRDEGFEQSHVMDYAWYLSEVIGPRLSGSPNIREAQRWTRLQMEIMGLQNTVIEPWGEHGANWEVKYVSIHMLEPDYQPIIGYPLGFTPGTKGNVKTTAVIVDIQSNEDFDKYRGTLSGAIVLATPKRTLGPRMAPDGIRHDAASLTAYETQGIDINLQRRREAVWMQNPPQSSTVRPSEIEAFLKAEGVAVVLQAGRGSDGTVFLTGSERSRRDRSLKGIQESLPTLAIAAEHYNRLYRLVEHGLEVQMEIDVQIAVDDSDTQEFNVVGEIAGSDLAGEVVMIGAHLDSWHSGTGATDNASGCAVVMEAMRILKAIGVQPRRTIRMALWSMEEGGLRGSRAYVERHFGNPRDGLKDDYETFSVYFNVDNGTGQFRGVHQQGNPYVAPIFEAWMKPFNDLNIKHLSTYSNRGTDHLAFDEAGLPGFQFIQDRIEYRTRTWHSSMDVFDKLLPEDLKRNAVLLASFAYHAAMRDGRFPRKQFTAWNPRFDTTQADVFAAGLSLTNAFADYDNDGDLDLFVGFNGQPNRLYRNNEGTFTDVAVAVGLADQGPTRSSAWGDYDNDGHMDLLVGFASRDESWATLYRNSGDGRRFTDVTQDVGIHLTGSFRQVSWIDYDNDGDVDLFVGLRDKPNVLLRNDNGKFIDVSSQIGIDDPRKTVGAVWFDYDQDGDLDVYVTNMDGDGNGLFRNDGDRFIDVASELGVESGGRALGMAAYGSVRPSLGDYDNDGDLDIFIANYGPNALYENQDGQFFINVAPQLGLAIDGRYDTGTWCDYDNDGRLDLYVNGTVTGGIQYMDYLFHNDGDRFSDVTPDIIRSQHADHSAQWADVDLDGDMDLALTGVTPEGMHYILINEQPQDGTTNSLQVLVLDADGHYTLAGAEVRLYKAGSTTLIGTQIVDTGSGYNSQNAMPVHFGIPAGVEAVDVELTVLTQTGRKSQRMSNVKPEDYKGRVLVVRVNRLGEIVE